MIIKTLLLLFILFVILLVVVVLNEMLTITKQGQSHSSHNEHEK